MKNAETEGEIITREVALRVECPCCSREILRPIDEFDETDLWYGQEHVVCDGCGAIILVYHVERF